MTDVPFKVYRPSSSPSSPAAQAAIPESFFNPLPDPKPKTAPSQTTSSPQPTVVSSPSVNGTGEITGKTNGERWPNTTIRIRFQDRTQLERVFESRERIKSVYTFVRECLREDMRSNGFILYQTPPKRDLKETDPKVEKLSLARLQLAPSSVLMLRFENEAYNGTDNPAPLSPEVLAKAIDLPGAKTYYNPPSREDESEDPLQAISKMADDGFKKVSSWFKSW